jgi:hypothetical protein
MKSKEEIEQLAENSSYNNSEHFEDYQDGMFYGYIKGYTQCQEDMNKKYTEEDVFVIAKKLWNDIFNNETLTYNSFEEYFNNKIKK